ncbi:MAG: polysaccharide biosynthesis tyrosine autokinase [Acidimicrobiales bacterium]
MEVTKYIGILRRRAWFVVQAVLVVAIVAGVASSLRPPSYHATTRVLLQPDNPAEQLNPGQPVFRDANRFVQAQIDIAESEAVARQAAEALPDTTARQIERQVSASASDDSDVLRITASDGKATRARDLANAVAASYIENRRKSAVAGLERASADLEAKLAPLRDTLAELDGRIRASSAPNASGGESPDALRSARDATALQYETLYARQQELAVNISLQRGGAEIIAEAKIPAEPSSPKPVRDAVLGALVGLLVGCGIVMLREQLDDRIRSVADVEATLGVPLLAELPFDPESAEKPGQVATIARPQGLLSEAVRSLRTSIQYLGVDQPVKLLVVTSAVPGEGKSVVAANLAAAYAQAGHRTVLIGADLRRPRLSELFQVQPGTPGLVDAVARRWSDKDAAPGANPGDDKSLDRLLTRPMRNLAFIHAGPTPPNPAELLGTRRMHELLGQLGAAADVVILDTPPLLPVTDAAVLAAKADGVIIVLAMNESRRQAVTRAKAIIEGTHARLLGVVINKATRSDVPYYYSGYNEDTTFTGNGSGPRTNGARTGRRKGSRQTR